MAKLSTRQAEVLRLMEEGWEMTTNPLTVCWLRKDEKWSISVGFNTFESLRRKDLVVLIKYRFPTKYWGLAPPTPRFGGQAKP